MQIAKELNAATANIRFYVKQICELNSRQFDLDFENYKLGKEMNENELLGKLRIQASGQVGASCEIILQCCQNIEGQVKLAEEQDKKG